MSECDRKALLCAQGAKSTTKLYRRSDGKFVLGDCLKKRMPANLVTGAGFALAPIGTFATLAHSSALLLAPGAMLVMLPLFGWAMIGAWIVSRTRSATVSGILFAVFVIPALLAPYFLL
jgi:hypothetical protein